jgi:hypothetical protein
MLQLLTCHTTSCFGTISFVLDLWSTRNGEMHVDLSLSYIDLLFEAVQQPKSGAVQAGGRSDAA